MEIGVYHEFHCRPDQTAAAAFEEALGQIEAADRWGLDAIWLAEIHQQPPDGIHGAGHRNNFYRRPVPRNQTCAVTGGREDHDRHGADYRADHSEPALPQRSSELRLAHDRGGGTGPKRAVELEPERDEQREANGSPEPNTEEQWCTSIREHIHQAPSTA